MKSEIIWFSVENSLPFLGKMVLATDGESISISKIDSILPHSNVNGVNDNWEVRWQHGTKVTHWSFLPEIPVVAKNLVATKENGPSVW